METRIGPQREGDGGRCFLWMKSPLEVPERIHTAGMQCLAVWLASPSGTGTGRGAKTVISEGIEGGDYNNWVGARILLTTLARGKWTRLAGIHGLLRFILLCS